MDFTAIDFETGNSYYTSACSIGVSVFENNEPVKQYSRFIKPPQEAGNFHWYNVKIHGIKQSDLENEPNFAEVWAEIKQDIENKTLVCHNAVFDTAVLRKCLEFYNIPFPNFNYICTVKVSQKLWPDLENHKLNTVADALGITLNHHEAGSDAHACGEILQCALRETHCADAQALAEHLGMQLGVISPAGRRQCSSAKKSGTERKSHTGRHRKTASNAVQGKGEDQ